MYTSPWESATAGGELLESSKIWDRKNIDDAVSTFSRMEG